jgi:hypothetical protein
MHLPGPFAEHTVADIESILNPTAKQDAEEREARIAFEQKAAVLGMNDPQTIDCLNNLAWCLRNRRKFSEAETLFLAAFDSSKDTLVLDDPDRLQVLARNLMTVLIDQNKTMETREIWETTKSLFETNVPEDRADSLVERLKLVYVFHEEPVLGIELQYWKRSWTRDLGFAGGVPTLSDSIAPMRFPSIRTEGIRTNIAPSTERLIVGLEPEPWELQGSEFNAHLSILADYVFAYPFPERAVEQRVSQLNQRVNEQILRRINSPCGFEHPWNIILNLFRSVIRYSHDSETSELNQILRSGFDSLKFFMFNIIKVVLGLDDARKFFAEEATGSLSSLHRGLGPGIDECNAIGTLIRRSLKNIRKAMKVENSVRNHQTEQIVCH